MHGGHLDDEGKQIIDKCVEGLIHEGLPWHMGHALELPVDEQLGSHHDET